MTTVPRPPGPASDPTPATKPRQARKRADGEGTLYRRADGLWIGDVMIGRTRTGARARRSVSAKTQGEARRKLDALKAELAGGVLADPHRLTVAEFFTDWLERTVKVRRAPATYRQYESLVRVHALPALGHRALKAVKAADLDRLYRQLEADAGDALPGRRRATGRALAPKTIRGLHVALHAGFERAVRMNLLARNPADGVDLPSLPGRRPLPIDVADVQRLLSHAEATGDRLWALWTVLVNAGLRIGEALALRWASVDLDGGWLAVTDGGGATGRTKTAAGDRVIPLTSPAGAALRAHRDRQRFERDRLGDSYAGNDLVFCTRLGTPLDARHALHYLKVAAAAAGVGGSPCLHDLRRMTASLLVAGGVDIATAAAIMGHKNASVLLDVYAHALRAPKLAAAERLAGTLYGQFPH